MMSIVTAACIIGCLHVLAAYYREHTRLHDLRVRVVELRREYSERLARMNAVVDVGEADDDGVDVVPDTGGVNQSRQAA